MLLAYYTYIREWHKVNRYVYYVPDVFVLSTSNQDPSHEHLPPLD